MNMNIGESKILSPKQPNHKKKRGGAPKDVTLITNDLFENIGPQSKLDLNVIKN